MKFATAAILLTVTAISACSGIPRRESDAAMLARYSSYAGEPVTEFRTYSAFDSWSPVDNHHVLIHTNVNEAYLVTVCRAVLSTCRLPRAIARDFAIPEYGAERVRLDPRGPGDLPHQRDPSGEYQADARGSGGGAKSRAEAARLIAGASKNAC